MDRHAQAQWISLRHACDDSDGLKGQWNTSNIYIKVHLLLITNQFSISGISQYQTKSDVEKE